MRISDWSSDVCSSDLDIRGQGQRLSMGERIARLTASIKRVQVSMKIDYRDTLANIFFDGLSASESFFMEALYESGRFPCLFVGGSAGGKLAFQKTQMHEGKRSYQNNALIVDRQRGAEGKGGTARVKHR